MQDAQRAMAPGAALLGITKVLGSNLLVSRWKPYCVLCHWASLVSSISLSVKSAILFPQKNLNAMQDEDKLFGKAKKRFLNYFADSSNNVKTEE